MQQCIESGIFSNSQSMNKYVNFSIISNLCEYFLYIKFLEKQDVYKWNTFIISETKERKMNCLGDRCKSVLDKTLGLLFSNGVKC